jgi:hypothetical protein
MTHKPLAWSLWCSLPVLRSGAQVLSAYVSTTSITAVNTHSMSCNSHTATAHSRCGKGKHVSSLLSVTQIYCAAAELEGTLGVGKGMFRSASGRRGGVGGACLPHSCAGYQLLMAGLLRLKVRFLAQSGGEVLAHSSASLQLRRSPGRFSKTVHCETLCPSLFPRARIRNFICGEAPRILHFPESFSSDFRHGRLPSGSGQFPDGQRAEGDLGKARDVKPLPAWLDPCLTSPRILAANSSPSPHLSPDTFDGCGSARTEQVSGLHKCPLRPSTDHLPDHAVFHRQHKNRTCAPSFVTRSNARRPGPSFDCTNFLRDPRSRRESTVLLLYSFPASFALSTNAIRLPCNNLT